MIPANIITAIEEICTGEIGAVETVAAGALQLGAYASANDEAKIGRAFQNPRCEITVKQWKATDLTPRFSDTAIHEIEVDIAIHVTTGFELNDTNRATARALMMTLGERVAAACTRPGNMSTTSTGGATGLISGCAMSANASVESEDFKKRLIAAKISLKMLVASTRPT